MNAAAVLVACCLAATAAAASPPHASLRTRSLDLAYNLDFDGARATMREALARDPDDPLTHLADASLLWVTMLFQRGGLTVDEYLGPPSLDDVARTPVSPTNATALRDALTRARSLAEARLRINPGDVNAWFAVGAAAGRESAFLATEEGRLMRAFWTSRRAYDAHQRVLRMDPTRKDAGLIVGTYRYLVATLSTVARWLAYLAGFGGNKAEAIRLLEASAETPNESGIESRFALVIVYSREGMHDFALRQLDSLRARYPDNRLLWLETGATLLRAGRPAEALPWLDEGLTRLRDDRRPRSFGEEAWWHYQRGQALAGLGQGADAASEARLASDTPAYRWVRGRIRTLAGKAADLAGDRSGALAAYTEATTIARATGDALGVSEARRWIDNPFRGTSAFSPRQKQ